MAILHYEDINESIKSHLNNGTQPPNNEVLWVIKVLTLADQRAMLSADNNRFKLESWELEYSKALDNEAHNLLPIFKGLNFETNGVCYTASRTFAATYPEELQEAVKHLINQAGDNNIEYLKFKLPEAPAVTSTAAEDDTTVLGNLKQKHLDDLYSLLNL